MVGCGSLLGGACGSSSKDPPAAEGCEPGSTFCSERQVWLCDDGTPSLIESCSDDEECREEGDEASCRSTCFPGQATCDGDVATICDADGAGPKPGGTDCTEDGRICEQGECVDADCTPGESLCRNGDVYTCGVSGKDIALIDICMGDEICDPVLARCGLPTCEAGERDCDGARVVECSATGTGWQDTGVDCASEGEVCFEGKCEEPSCTAGTKICMDDAVYACPDGLETVLEKECDTGYHCLETPATSSAICALNDCVPGQPVCHLNLLKTCTDQGTYPQEGTECGDDVCAGGECVPVICTPFEVVCRDGEIKMCDAYGAGYMLFEECGDGFTCALLADTPECIGQACTPGETGCVGNAIGECADDGVSLVSVTDDCAGGGNVCDASNACAASAVDVAGVGEGVDPFGAEQIVGNVLDVHSNRRITALEANLNLEEPRDLRWVVGAWNGSSFDVVASLITTNNPAVSGFFSSGALDYELEAGKRYLVGVGTVLSEAYIYRDEEPWDRELSFGSLIGGNSASYGSKIDESLYTYQLYALRLTTELP